MREGIVGPGACRGLALAAFLALSGLPGCARSGGVVAVRDSASPAPGGRFVYPLPIEPISLDFVTGTDLASSSVTRLIGDGLVDHDAAWNPVPRLAERWEWEDGGRALVFHLRKGVKFHDGIPLTSADVLFTYERAVNPKTRAVGRVESFLPVERVDAPDDRTVRVVYRRPFAPALQGWEMPILPRHLYAGKDPEGLNLQRAPVGSGPFKFVSWESGRRILLAANTDYWGGRPYLDLFDFEIIPSQDTALQALLAGEVDFARLTPVQWQAHAGDASFERRFTGLRYTPFFMYDIAWRGDGSNPFFTDPRVRLAMTLALDREGYVRSVLRGLGEVRSSPFRPAALGREGDLPVIPYDPARAAELLDQAGWRIDQASGLRRKNGSPFRFTMLIYGVSEDHLQFSQVAQEGLRRLGITMDITRLDWPTLLTRLRSGRFEAALTGIAPSPDPDSMYTPLHSSQIDGGQNYAAFRDSQVDAWLDEGRGTLDPARRREIYRRIDALLQTRQPYTFLFSPVVQGAVARRVGNVNAGAYGILDPYPGPAAFFILPGADR